MNKSEIATQINANDLRAQRLSLLIGTMIGQISELLYHIQGDKIYDGIYHRLEDIHRMATSQVHEFYCKGLDKNE